MHKFFYLALALTATSLYADQPKPQAPNQVRPEAPKHSPSEIFLVSSACSFETHGTALWLQPSSDNLHYAAQAQPLPIATPDWFIYDFSPDYTAAFDVGIKGIFRGAHTYAMLNWEHFHSSDTASTQVPSNDMIGPFFEIGPDADDYKKATGKVSFHFDQANLAYGISVKLGHRLLTNLYTGVNFARIKETRFSSYSSLDGATTRTLNVPSTFTGAGPQMGLDFSYKIVKGFRFVGAGAASLLIGTNKNHTTYTSTSPLLPVGGAVSPNIQTTTVSNTTQMVPAFNGKLGLAYAFLFCDHFLLKLEAGYQAEIYLNAIQSIDMGSEVPASEFSEPLTVGVFARTFQTNSSNFALAGPYLRLDFGF